MSIVAACGAADAACFDVIVPGLALGNETAAHDRALLKSRNVIALLNITRTDNPWAALLRRRGVAYMQVGVDDRRTEELYPFFDECCAFISRHRVHALEAAAAADATEGRGGSAGDHPDGEETDGDMSPCVLVHCHQGTSRSVTVLIAYLMRRYSLTLRYAFNFVLDHRPMGSAYTHPNPAFLMQLVRWEANLGLRPPSGPSLEFLEYSRGAAAEWDGRNRGPCRVGGCRCEGWEGEGERGQGEEGGRGEAGRHGAAPEVGQGAGMAEVGGQAEGASLPPLLTQSLSDAAAWCPSRQRTAGTGSAGGGVGGSASKAASGGRGAGADGCIRGGGGDERANDMSGGREAGLASLYWRLVRGQAWTSPDEVLHVQMSTSVDLESLELRLTQRHVAKGIIDPDALGTNAARDWAVVRISTECLPPHAQPHESGGKSTESGAVAGAGGDGSASAPIRSGWREVRFPAFLAHLARPEDLWGEMGWGDTGGEGEGEASAGGEGGAAGAGSVPGDGVSQGGAGVNTAAGGVNAPVAGVSVPSSVSPSLSSIWADGTWSGTLFWDSALYLSHMLLSPSSAHGGRWRRRIQQGGAVLELGCGLGLPGCVTHLLGAPAVILTDRPCIVQLVREAIGMDQGLQAAAGAWAGGADSGAGAAISGVKLARDATSGAAAAEAFISGSIPSLAAVPFAWDEAAASALLNRELRGRAPSIILACDCIFAPLFGESFLLLLMLLALAAPPAEPVPAAPLTGPPSGTLPPPPLASPDVASPPGPPDGTLVLLSLERRPGDGAEAFFAQAARAGFETTVVRREGRVLVCEMMRRR